jgi:L-fucose mutarotase/ribose pyranase (RbsD/FucU family)
MADAFAPQLSSEVRFNQPVETPSTFGALAEVAGSFVKSFASAKEDSKSAAPKTDPNLVVFQKGLERVEAIRELNGEAAAQIAERRLASNFAAQGISFGKEYEDVYTTVTGRPWQGYGMDVEATILQDKINDPKFQALYTAGIAVLGSKATEEQLMEYALGQESQMAAMENEIARSKTEASYKWTTQSEAAYGGAVDTFTNTIFGGMATTVAQGGRVGPQEIANVQAQWAQLKLNLTRPSGVSDDQWKAIQDKINAVDATLTAFEKAGSNEVLLNEITSAFARSMIEQGEGSPESYAAAMVAIKDQTTLLNLAQGKVEQYLMETGKSLNLKVTTSDMFGHIVSDQGSVIEADPNALLTDIPPDIKSRLSETTIQQVYDGLNASGQLAGIVKPADLNRPEAREQFTENSVTIGAVLMNNKENEFLSESFLKQLVGNPQFIGNIKALDAIDPEAATVARTYVRSGLNTEKARQQRNLEAIEANLGVTWNGSTYVLDPQALMTKNGWTKQQADGFVAWVGKTYGGDLKKLANGLVPMPEGMPFQPVGLNQAFERRGAINVIDQTMKALEVPVEAPQGQAGALDATSATAPTGSVTAQLLDKFEGGGDYNALFGFANREGGPFAGTNVSQMTIGELKAFADGEYADYSRKQLGYKATPMGRYQFVGSTLSAVAQRMGLPDDTVFSPEVQDQMFVFHAQEVMDGKSPAGKRAALRGTWEGLRNASDAELDQMIAEIEGGTASFGTTGVSGGGFRGARPTDANAVAAQVGGAMQRAVENAPAPSAPAPTTTEVAPASTEAAVADMPVDFSNAATGVMPQEDQAQAQTPAVDPEVQALINNLSPKTKRQLRLAGIEPNEVKFYQTEEEAQAAIETGELVEGMAFVLPDGSVRLVEGEQ